jgi:hypothetical protein
VRLKSGDGAHEQRDRRSPARPACAGMKAKQQR